MIQGGDPTGTGMGGESQALVVASGQNFLKGSITSVVRFLWLMLDQIQMVAVALSFKRHRSPYAKRNSNVVDGQRQSEAYASREHYHLDVVTQSLVN